MTVGFEKVLIFSEDSRYKDDGHLAFLCLLQKVPPKLILDKYRQLWVYDLYKFRRLLLRIEREVVHMVCRSKVFFLVQLPLPDPSVETSVLNAVKPTKDVDGFHPVNVGRMMLGLPTFLPCTPHGILHMLKRSGHETSGRHVVIVGRSNIVGRPLANLLSQKSSLGNATVTMCHTGTRNLPFFTKQADILIAATGRPHTITADMVREGVVVVDVGVNRVSDPSSSRGFRLVGDVDFHEVAEKAAAITPVPGGVGPMTITMLLHNTIQSARMHAGLTPGWT